MDDFPKLKKLLLVTGGSDDDANSRFCFTPGHVVCKDKLSPHGLPEGSEIHLEQNKRRYDQAVRVETQFQELDLRDEDKQRGVPKVRISEANRITNIPGED
jgi:hypothetical protein